MAAVPSAGAEETETIETYGIFDYKTLTDNTVSIIAVHSNDPEIVIPNNIDGKAVTIIGTCDISGNRPFGECVKTLEHVVLPNTLKIIGNMCFVDCEKLTAVDMPDSLKEIRVYAFSNCTSLEKLTIPDTVKDIHFWALDETAWFRNFPDDYVVAGDGILCGYKGDAEDVVVPDGVKTINPFCFFGKRSF